MIFHLSELLDISWDPYLLQTTLPYDSNRGFAEHPLELKWLPKVTSFLRVLLFFPPLYFHNENDLYTSYKRVLYHFPVQTPLPVDLKDGRLPAVDMVTN